MLDFELTDEQLAWRKIARDFSAKEIRPIAEKLDRCRREDGDRSKRDRADTFSEVSGFIQMTISKGNS